MLNYLNGVNKTNMNGLLDKFTTLKNNAIQKLPPAIKKAVDAGGKVAQVGVKISLAPMRSAFLGLIRLNALHVAENVEKAIRKDRKKVENWWFDFGGDMKELINITNLGIKAGQPGKAQALKGLGSLVVAGGATAVSAPILTSLVDLLKKIGVDAVKDLGKAAVDTGKKALEDSAKKLADEAKKALTDALNTGKLPVGVTPTVLVAPKGADTTQPTKTTEVAPTTQTATEKKSNMPLIIGGIAVLGIGAFFLLKKKK